MNTPTNSVHRCHIAILETSVNAANAYISKYGKPSKDMGRLINQQMREFASHHGSQAAAELAGIITDWKIQPILRESMQNIQAKYASFSPCSTTGSCIHIDHRDDIILLIREAYDHPVQDTSTQEKFSLKIMNSVARHAKRFKELGENVYVLSYQYLREPPLAQAQQKVWPSIIGSIEAGFAIGCLTLYMARDDHTRTEGYDSVNTHCPLTNALTEIIENPSNAKAYDAGRFALSFIYDDIYNSSHDGQDCINAIAHNRKESGARRIAAMQTLEKANQNSPWMRLCKLVRPKAYAACTIGHPSSTPR